MYFSPYSMRRRLQVDCSSRLVLPALGITEYNPKYAPVADPWFVQQYGAVQLAQFARNEQT
jgi:hypothetical protein